MAAAQPNTVVVGVAPGPVLMPWAHSAAAVALAFMPGLEYGHAIADVLYGDVNPSGRLSLTMPNKWNEIGFTPANWPGVNGAANYSERLEVGYRWYDSHKVEPAFPFGHGLSFTTFEYSELKVAGRDVSLTVANTGKVVGAEVVQLYVQFPAAAGEPPQQLRAFDKVTIRAGESAPVSFTLTDADLSIWDVDAKAWSLVKGVFGVAVGASSRDLRVKGSLTV